MGWSVEEWFVERCGVRWSGMECGGVGCSGLEWFVERCGVRWNGMECGGVVCRAVWGEVE